MWLQSLLASSVTSACRPFYKYLLLSILWLVSMFWSSPHPVLGEATAVVPFFYYRMNAILPKMHLFNSKLLRGLLYFSIYGVIDIVLPVPLFYAALTYENQTKLKTELLQEYLVYYEDFMSDNVLVVRFGNDNPFATAIVLLLLTGSLLGLGLIVLCTAMIFYYTHKRMVHTSERSRQHQRSLFIALASMVSNG